MLFHFDAAPVLAGRLYSRSLISVRISKGGAFGNIKISKNSLWLTEQIYNQFIASFYWNQDSAFCCYYSHRWCMNFTGGPGDSLFQQNNAIF